MTKPEDTPKIGWEVKVYDPISQQWVIGVLISLKHGIYYVEAHPLSYRTTDPQDIKTFEGAKNIYDNTLV